MTITWAVPDASATQWVALAVAVAVPVVGWLGETLLRGFSRWLWRGGDAT